MKKISQSQVCIVIARFSIHYYFLSVVTSDRGNRWSAITVRMGMHGIASIVLLIF